MSFRSDFAAFAALAPAQRRIVVAALLLGPMFALSLRAAGLAPVLRFIEAHRREGARLPVTVPVRVDDVAALVGAALRRLPWQTRCLVRSLVIRCVLARRGEASVLRIGVRKQDGALEAHAWVEHGGRPLEDAATVARFAPFEADILPPGAFGL